jgi:rhodanese-related sulfurtransferase
MLNRPQVPEILATDVATRLNSDAEQRPVVVDVREPDEWAEGHISGAQHIPLGQLAARTGEIPQDREVVLVCHSGQRSAAATAMLLRAGYTQAINMTGGMVAWEKAHLPVER